VLKKIKAEAIPNKQFSTIGINVKKEISKPIKGNVYVYVRLYRTLKFDWEV